MQIKNDSFFSTMILTELEDIVGRDNMHLASAEKLSHAVDYYWGPRVWVDRGKIPEQPDVVVYPQDTRQVSEIVKVAAQHRIPVTPWGGGAGSQGGALPVHGGILVDMKKMCKVTEVNALAYTATAEAGIIHQDFEWALNEQGFSTMHFPASIGCSTLGGFLAHRGTGVLSTKYGKIEDLVVNLEVVLPNGDIINTLPVPRNASGPDLNQVFAGSEGTLGIITKATVKIFDEPQCRKYWAYLFGNMHDALEAGRKIMTRRLQPCVIRLYDEAETVHQIHRVLGIEKYGAYLVFGFDGYEDIVDFQLRHARDICEETAIEDLGSECGQKWWDSRYKFFYPPYIMDLPEAFGTMDTVATYDKVEEIYVGMKAAAEQFPGTKFIAHFSHWYEWGCMMYDRFIVDPAYVPEDPAEAMAMYNKIWYTCIRVAMEKGGVLNEHHGVGLKMGYLMREQYGSAFQVIQKLKDALDPHRIMNPDKMGL